MSKLRCVVTAVHAGAGNAARSLPRTVVGFTGFLPGGQVHQRGANQVPNAASADNQACSHATHHLRNPRRVPSKQPQGRPRLVRGVELPARVQRLGDTGPRASPGCDGILGRFGSGQPRNRMQLGSVVHLHHKIPSTSKAVIRQRSREVLDVVADSAPVWMPWPFVDSTLRRARSCLAGSASGDGGVHHTRRGARFA